MNRPIFLTPLLLSLNLLSAAGWQQAASPHLELSPDLQFQPRLRVTVRALEREATVGGGVPAEVTIENLSGTEAPVHLRLSSDSFQNLELEAFDENGEALERAEAFKIFLLERNLGRRSPQPSRLVDLRDRESFTYRVDLSRYFQFESEGVVHVNGTFRPAFQSTGTSWSFSVPEETFRLREAEPVLQPAAPKAREARAHGDVPSPSRAFDPETAPSDRVVQRFFEYQEEGRAPEMLELVDAAQLLENSYSGTEYFERYQNALPAERQVVLSEFRDFLKKQFRDHVDERVITEAKVTGDRARITMQARVKQNRKRWSHKFDALTGQFTYQWEDQAEPDLVLGGKFSIDLNRQEGGWKITRLEVGLQKAAPPSPGAIAPPRPAVKPLVLRDIQFQRGAAELLPASFATLEQLRDRLLSQHASRIELHGHTDNVGPRELNLDLSRRRAEAVVRYLSEHGISITRLRAYGHGPDQPIAENRSEEGRSKNRRVELVLVSP